jgi:uncharacterized protein YbjT (DUF2867 family)
VAIVLGATGLVGTEIVRQLLDDQNVAQVVTLVRRASGTKHPKLDERIVAFDAMEDALRSLRGDVLFSALGTTLRTAGSEAAQYKVDYTYQWQVARAAAENGVRRYVLVSAMGSDPQSRLFYPRMKGELERDVATLPFERTCILRPGFLDGDRVEVRRGERLALPVLRRMPKWRSLATVRPIHASVVARAALAVSRGSERGLDVIGPAELFELGEAK